MRIAGYLRRPFHILPYKKWTFERTAHPTDHISKWLEDYAGNWKTVPAGKAGQTVIDDIVRAIKDGRPSILLLPHGVLHNNGHYVVVKGHAEDDSGRPVFVVNDPLSGEYTLLARPELFEPLDGADRGKVLIAKVPTWLRRQASMTPSTDTPARAANPRSRSRGKSR